MKTGALVLGMIGAFLALPAALCSGLCATALSNEGGQQVSDTASAAGGAFLVIGLIAAVLAFASSILVMVRTRVGAYGLLGSFILTVVTCMTLNLIAFLVALFLFVAMLLAFFAAKEEAQMQQSGAPQLANPYGAAQYGAPPPGYGGPPAPGGYGPPQGGGGYGPPQGGGGYGPPQGGGGYGPPQGGGGYGPPQGGGTPPQNPWQ
jgi:uncharacterized membrane protein